MRGAANYMIKMKTTDIKEATYENIIVDCPYCHHECVFNRISDLETTTPIAKKDLKCQNKNCKESFRAIGDEVVPAKYRWFLDDLPFLKKNKKYGLYILTLCQACEVFMHQAIINKKIDKNPLYRDSRGFFCVKNKEDKNV